MTATTCTRCDKPAWVSTVNGRDVQSHKRRRRINAILVNGEVVCRDCATPIETNQHALAFGTRQVAAFEDMVAQFEAIGDTELADNCRNMVGVLSQVTRRASEAKWAVCAECETQFIGDDFLCGECRA